MRTQIRANRVAFRRAVCASVVIHIVAAASFLVLIQLDEPKPREPVIDTRAPHVAQIQMFLTEVEADIEVSPAPPTPGPVAPLVTEVPAPPVEAPTVSSAPVEAPATSSVPIEAPATSAGPALPAGPFTSAPPRTLPPELVARIRKPGPAPAPSAPASVRSDPNVKPAAAIATPARTPVVRPVHGAMRAGQTVVYVIDSSGSMGAGGKLGAAQAALGATLAQQSEAVRFQVIVYEGTAGPLLPSGAVALPATAENVRAATAKLAALVARGRSNHPRALRAALNFRPDVIVWLTDADDLTAAVLKSILRSDERSVPVCLALVTADGVQPLRELK